jgi:hypothetical protein
MVKAEAGAREDYANAIGLQLVPVEPYRWMQQEKARG